MDQQRAPSDRVDLVREQVELVALLEAKVDPALLTAVEQAYHAGDREPVVPQIVISYGGTQSA